MNQNNFWAIIASIRNQSQNDDALFYFLFQKNVKNMAPQDLENFNLYFYGYLEALNESVWPIMLCQVVNDSIEYDTVRNFNLWVLSQGYGAYCTALDNPDMLGDVVTYIPYKNAQFPQLIDVVGEKGYGDIRVETPNYYRNLKWGNYKNTEHALLDISNVLPRMNAAVELYGMKNLSSEDVEKLLKKWGVNSNLFAEYKNSKEASKFTEIARNVCTEYFDIQESLHEIVELLTIQAHHLFYCAVNPFTHTSRIVRFNIDTKKKNDIYKSTCITKVTYVDRNQEFLVFFVDHGYENQSCEDMYLIYNINANTINRVKPQLSEPVTLLNKAILIEKDLYFSAKTNDPKSYDIYRYSTLTHTTFKMILNAGMLTRYEDTFIFGKINASDKVHFVRGIYEFSIEREQIITHNSNIFYNEVSIHGKEGIFGLREGLHVWLNCFDFESHKMCPLEFDDVIPLVYNERMLVGWMRVESGQKLVIIDRSTKKLYSLEKGVIYAFDKNHLDWISTDSYQKLIKINHLLY